MRWLPQAVGRTSLSARRTLVGAALLLAMTASSCASTPKPAVPSSLVSVGPTGYVYTLAWTEPVTQVTDGTTVLKVVGPGQVTIESVGVMIEPASAPIAVAWSGVKVVAGTLSDAVLAAPGVTTGQAGEAFEGQVERAPGVLARAGAFYDVVTLLQASGYYAQPWTIEDTEVRYRVGSGAAQTLQIPQQVEVR